MEQKASAQTGAYTQRFDLGVEHIRAKRWIEAEAIYRDLVAGWPEAANAHYHLGIALHHQGKLDDAIAALRAAVARKPNFAEALNGLGNSLVESKRLAEAAEAYERVVVLRPDHAQAWNNLGNLYAEMDQRGKAVEAYQRALAIRPNFTFAWNNLGNALRDLYEPAQALEAFRRALALQADQPDTLGNIGFVLKAMSRLDEALDYYQRRSVLLPDDAVTAGDRLYLLYFHPGHDSASIHKESRQWNERFYRPLAGEILPHDNDPAPGRRLRVGYVSPDFRRHCEALFMLPLLSRHDRRNVEIFCYSSVTSPDAVTARHQRHADVWRDVKDMDDAALARQVREDKIDILVDLTLHMWGNRLGVFARKPAPIQVTWLGYAGTSGLDTMDYRLTDPRLDPLEAEIQNPKSEIRINDPNPNESYSRGAPNHPDSTSFGHWEIDFGELSRAGI